MMKIRKAAVLLMALCMMIAASAISVFADDYPSVMTVSSGNGTFASEVPDGIQSVTPVTGVDGALEITTSNGTTTVKVTPPADHFVSGVKVAGHDNVLTGAQSLGDSDVDLVVAYGLKTNMVKYTVRYETAGGGQVPGLPASEEFYGVSGDKPVVTYRYAEGYQPQAYRLTGTLSDGENVFTFVYSEAETGTGATNVVTVNDGTTTGGGAAGAGTAGTNIGDNATPQAEPQDMIDLDDNQTPTTDAPGTDATDIEDNKTPGVSWPVLGGGAVVILGIAAAAIALARRRGSEEEEE